MSRLVFDCNRSPDAPDAISELSEYIEIPGNVGLSVEDRLTRASRYYTPFCNTLIADSPSQQAMAVRLVGYLNLALEAIEEPGNDSHLAQVS